MTVNRFYRPVATPIINTYAPINFSALMLLGRELRQAVDLATLELNLTIQRFGEFQSPSDIDTQRYYDNSLGKLSGLIELAVADPDRMKDAAFRASLNAGIANLDYGLLSRLKLSREGLLARLKANQQLMLHDMYNPLVHDVDFAHYDTEKQGIFNDVSPLPYKSIVDMVKPYVDNLKDRYLGKHDGFIFNGVSEADTDAQVNANWSSIVNSPHYAQNLQLIKMLNPGISDEDAVNALNEQIFTAGREFARNKPERDPLELLYIKHRLDNPTPTQVNPTRLDFINETITKTVQPVLDNAYNTYMNDEKNADVINTYKDNLSSAVAARNAAILKYQNTGSAEALVKVKNAMYKVEKVQWDLQSKVSSYLLDGVFENSAGYNIDSFKNPLEKKETIAKTFTKGVKAGLDLLSGSIGIDREDEMFTRLNAKQEAVKDADGTYKDPYHFNTSAGFLLPETVYEFVTGRKEPIRDVDRYSGLLDARDPDFAFRELLESGAAGPVQFIPNGEKQVIKVGPGQLAIAGKLRIPVKNVENALGTGMVLGNWTAAYLSLGLFGRGSTRQTLENHYGSSVVKEAKINDEDAGGEFFEIDAYRALPDYYKNPEYWQGLNLGWVQPGNLGTTTLTTDTYPVSANQLLGR